MAAPPAAPGDAGVRKAIVAFDGDLTEAHLSALESLGVTAGFELRSIDAVAVTAPLAVLAHAARRNRRTPT